MKSTCLVIDNDKGILQLWKEYVPNVDGKECHDVETAVKVIVEFNPDKLFLDHNLSECHDGEGLQIVDILIERGLEIKIYTTTGDERVLPDYEKRGIEHVDKFDWKKIQSIMSESERIAM
jgi:response regulator of citrate/malate metabolism